MARLINDSGVLGDTMEVTAQNVNDVSFDKIIEAIHKVQVEMGVSGISAEEAAELVKSGALTQEEAFQLMGTTAKEASSTIEGSLNAAKAAWGNLLVGVADDTQDFDKLIERFVSSVDVAASNIMPRIEIIISGIGTLIERVAPKIGEAIPRLITNVLPSLLIAGSNLVSGLVSGIGQALPSLIQTGGTLLLSISRGVAEKLPEFLAAAPEIISKFIDYISTHMPEILDAGLEITGNLAEGILSGIPEIINNLPKIIESIVDFIIKSGPKIALAGVKLVISLSAGIVKAIPQALIGIAKLIGAIIKGLGDLVLAATDIGVNVVKGVWNGIKSMGDWIYGKVSGFFKGILNGAKKVLGIHSPSKVFQDEVGVMIGLGVAGGINKSTSHAVKAAESLAKSVYDKSVQWVDVQSKYFNLSLRDQLDVWKTIQGQFIKGSKQYTDAENAIFDTREKLREEYYDKVNDITNKIADIEGNYSKKLEERQREIFNSFGLFDKIVERQSVSGDALINNLKNQVESIDEYYAKLFELENRGVASGLVDEFRNMGPAAINELNALLSLTDEKLTEYSNLYQEKQSLANKIALKEMEPFREKADQEIQGLMQQIDNIYTENAPLIGDDFSSGVARGILDGQPKIIDAVNGAMLRIEERAKEAAAKMAASIASVISFRMPDLDATMSRSAPSGAYAPRFGTENSVVGAAGALGMAMASSADRPIVLSVDGVELGRVMLPHMRAANKQSPMIVSDKR